MIPLTCIVLLVIIGLGSITVSFFCESKTTQYIAKQPTQSDNNNLINNYLSTEKIKEFDNDIAVDTDL